MLTQPPHSDAVFDEPKRSIGLKVIAAGCAVLVTAALFAGYAYLRKRHAKQSIASASQAQTSSTTPKGPPQAHILMDEAMLKGRQTFIGGAVKNISRARLEGLSVELELRYRKNGAAEQRLVVLDPPQLEPDQEGRYSLVLQAQDYSSVRLAGLRGNPNSTLLTYTSSQGQKRPLERLEPKVVTVPKSSGRDGFLNSPDNPARVP